MKRFLNMTLLFFIPVLAGFIAVAFMADGYADPFYLRLTSPPQQALIVGSSRAAQGLQPAIINPMLAKEYKYPLYNFSFTSTYSPFGPSYFDAIRKKLSPGVKNSVFIVSVDAWSLTAGKTAPEDSIAFAENQSFLAHSPWINSFPCFTYLVRDYPMPYLTLLTGKLHRLSTGNGQQKFQLHDDGWLEINNPMDSIHIKNRQQDMFRLLDTVLNTGTLSKTRLAWLSRTISFLKESGEVYMVRLPAHPQLLALENKLAPGLNQTLDSIARLRGIPFYNFTDSCSKYTYTDGSHLWKVSGATLSRELAHLIINHKYAR